jgi:hypothetical protein
VDPATIEIVYVLWFSLADSLPPDAQLAIHDGYLNVVSGRISEHLEATAYSPETGDECGVEGCPMRGPCTIGAYGDL